MPSYVIVWPGSGCCQNPALWDPSGARRCGWAGAGGACQFAFAEGGPDRIQNDSNLAPIVPTASGSDKIAQKNSARKMRAHSPVRGNPNKTIDVRSRMAIFERRTGSSGVRFSGRSDRRGRAVSRLAMLVWQEVEAITTTVDTTTRSPAVPSVN